MEPRWVTPLLQGGATHAFRWTPGGGIEDIHSEAGNSLAYDVNNAENVVGESGRAFRWTSSTGMVIIDSTPGTANDLNESSEAVGTRNLAAADRTIRWSFSDALANPFPTTNSRGVAINNANEIVGTTNFGVEGYFHNGTTDPRVNLGAFLPTDMNDSREIVGSIGGIAALLDFDTSTTTMLGKLSFTDTSSRALGINADGRIVGISEGTGGFLYDSSMGGLQNLSTMLASEYSGWTILAAEDINNLGQIVGVGRFGGVDHAVVLTSVVPEPSTAIASLLILLMLSACRRWIAIRGNGAIRG